MPVDGAPAARKAWNRGNESGFEWVSSSPSPATVCELEARFPEVVQIPSSVLEASSASWMESAVLARTFQRWLPPEAFIREFHRAGVSGEIHSVCLAHRCYVFRFETPGAKELVVGRPWVVNGQPVATEEWRPEFIPAADSIPSILLWVRLPALPLEFWNDEALAAILEPAGQFVCSDEATRTMARGAFARACVRIELRQPLRPGVRVQGTASPFWQTFQFEHLVGICQNCGSIHLDGLCSLAATSSEVEKQHSSQLFGPWMSAFRQRKFPSSSDPKKAANGARNFPGTSAEPSPSVSRPGGGDEGWLSPTKVARRRAVKSGGKGAIHSGILNQAPAEMTMEDGSSGNVTVSLAVPVGKHCAGSTVALKPAGKTVTYHPKHSEKQQLDSKNPFALHGKGNEEGRPVARVDVNPGPSKRARPEEAFTQRTGSKGGSRKGKGIKSNIKDSKDKTIITESGYNGLSHDSEVRRSVMVFGSQGKASGGEMGLSSKAETRCHDEILSCLKLAIKKQDIDSTRLADEPRVVESEAVDGCMDTVITQMDCSSQENEGDSRCDKQSSHLAMVEDTGEIHPPTNC